MKTTDLKKFPSTLLGTSNLPDTPGVYFFMHGKEVLYIGKATSLKDRVKSYFAHDILMTRSPLIAKMLKEANKVEFIKTDSVLEALLLEASQIKKFQPIYNSKEKDDKSYNYVTITEENFPRVFITRGSGKYGPFPYGSELKTALKIIRKIFPYRDKCIPEKGKPCFNAQIGLCPGVCAGWISKKDYRKVIKNLKLFFEAKKPRLTESLEKDMKVLAKKHKFEEAEKIKRQIFALNHIQDIALIKQDITSNLQTSNFRIEAYDIAHLSGKNAVGVMTVIEGGELNKSQYRKFKIKNDKNDDINNLKEVISRRLTHSEWRFPDLVVVDGGRAQINAARELLEKLGLNISVVSVIKDEKHKAREIIGLKDLTLNSNPKGQTLGRSIFLANSEAHRFAINYHRKLRGKGFRI